MHEDPDCNGNDATSLGRREISPISKISSTTRSLNLAHAQIDFIMKENLPAWLEI
jgi:hypothetical protein